MSFPLLRIAIHIQKQWSTISLLHWQPVLWENWSVSYASNTRFKQEFKEDPYFNLGRLAINFIWIFLKLNFSKVQATALNTYAICQWEPPLVGSICLHIGPPLVSRLVSWAWFCWCNNSLILNDIYHHIIGHSRSVLFFEWCCSNLQLQLHLQLQPHKFDWLAYILAYSLEVVCDCTMF